MPAFSRGRIILALALFSLAAAPAVAQITGDSWLPLGPAPGNFNNQVDGISGRATVIAPNPHNPDDLWIGTAQGGVWHSTDGGETWVPTTDDQESLAVGAIALKGCDATGCARIFVGTGENAIRRDTFYGQGFMIGTMNQGEVTWSLNKGTPYDFSYASIYNVVIDPDTSGSTTEIYITLSSGVTASASQSTVTAPEPDCGYGIYRSQFEGSSWEKLEIPEADGARPTDLEMDPNNPDVLYAGFLDTGIFKTTDGGATWCPLNPGLGLPAGCSGASGLPAPGTFDFVQITPFQGDSEILYARLDSCPDPLLLECEPVIYKTEDAGQTWDPIDWKAPHYCMDGYSRYTHVLAVHPTNPATVLLGGTALCRSEDGGLNWERSQFQVDVDKNIHADHRQVVFLESDPQIAFQVGDGGITRSTDGGVRWKAINGNLQTIGFQSIATSPHTARVIGGTQDNAGQMWVGTRSWDLLPCCGDGGFSVMDRNDVNTMYVTTNAGDLPSTRIVPNRSDDGGQNFEDPDDLNAGLDTSDPQAFYSPLVQDPSAPHPLYFGTNRLWKSTDQVDSWTAISPVLSTTPSSEIWAGQDVIAAIAVAPSVPDRIYIAYYSGKVYRTDNACAQASCWEQVDSGLPDSNVTWVAVDPGDANTAYATLGGFFGGVHVYKTTNGGNSWSAVAGHSEMNGVPANTIAIEPSFPERLWVGTDNGVFRSTNGGDSWTRLTKGMPNVPVFEISIDESRGRLFAGTHGRGAFVLSRPFVGNLEGWVDGDIWDVPFFGSGFFPDQDCTVKLLRQDLSVCAESSNDVFGGDVVNNDDWELVSSEGTMYENQYVIWACNQQNCLGGTPIEDCNEPGNELAAMLVICGDQIGINVMSGCPVITAPPSSWFSLTGLEEFLSQAQELTEEQANQAPGGTFELIPVLFAGDGTTEVLCRVDVPVAADDTVHDVILLGDSLVDGDANCIAAGLTAEIVEGRQEGALASEDNFAAPDRLRLDGPDLVGGQLVPSVCTTPGSATGMAFELSRLGTPLTDQLLVMRIRFETGVGGATGGTISLIERSMLGGCQVEITTQPGDTAEQIAQALSAAFQAPGIPGPPTCPASANARDVFASGNSVFTVLPRGIEIEVTDGNVGFCAAPEEVCFADGDCDDDNPCTRDTCNVATGQCAHTPEPDGLPCDDSDACTIGNTCNAGSCGMPLVCDDSDPCTDDFCLPDLGICRSRTVDCDDGNPCSADACNATTGECEFTPLTGPCTDGDPCTMGDTCVFDPAEQQSTCQGSTTCDDGDPCTNDLCDAITGACTVEPYDCDDGNPCTVNFCNAGSCDLTFVTGICDDGDPCTQGDQCELDGMGGVSCEGQSPTCSDGDVCTTDVCHPVFGTCDHPAIPIAQAGTLNFESSVRFSWGSGSPDAIYWNSYRGTIPATGFASGAGYDHQCFEFRDAGGNGATASEDLAVPPPGTAFYYDATLVAPCGEGPLGDNSDGAPRPVIGACEPTPAE
jgi:photosystem II stability/assembly factor-like uncharacterized protein